MGDIEHIYSDDLLVLFVRWDSHGGGTDYDERWGFTSGFRLRA